MALLARPRAKDRAWKRAGKRGLEFYLDENVVFKKGRYRIKGRFASQAQVLKRVMTAVQGTFPNELQDFVSPVKYSKKRERVKFAMGDLETSIERAHEERETGVAEQASAQPKESKLQGRVWAQEASKSAWARWLGKTGEVLISVSQGVEGEEITTDTTKLGAQSAVIGSAYQAIKDFSDAFVHQERAKRKLRRRNEFEEYGTQVHIVWEHEDDDDED